MWSRIPFAAAGLVALAGLLPPPAPAQDPKADAKVAIPADVIPSTFRMFMVTDDRFEPLKDAEGKPLVGSDGKPVPNPKNRQGKIHCLVCENGLAPMVVAFVRANPDNLKADSGVKRLAKGLDAMIPNYRGDKLGGFVAFLNLEGGTKVVTVKTKKADGTEVEEKVEVDLEYPDTDHLKRDAAREAVLGLAGALNVPNVPFGLAPSKSKALTAWGVTDAEVTVFVYYRMRKVGPGWTFAKDADLTQEKVDEILKTVRDTITDTKK
jgi:hypothetical protein